jgi:hypothetical protein
MKTHPSKKSFSISQRLKILLWEEHNVRIHAAASVLISAICAAIVGVIIFLPKIIIL